jgi:hypothetical protein
MLVAQQGRRQKMYYRLAIQQGRDQLDRPSTWQWKSTALSSLPSLFQVLRLYSALPQEHLRVFSSPSREGLEEQLRQGNRGLDSASVTAAHFLHQRMIHSGGVASADRPRGHEETTSIAVSTRTRLDENGIAAHALDESGIRSLEKRRTELEHGVGGDLDLPYRFTLPTSMPQVLAWMKLLAQVQNGALQP